MYVYKDLKNLIYDILNIVNIIKYSKTLFFSFIEIKTNNRHTYVYYIYINYVCTYV